MNRLRIEVIDAGLELPVRAHSDDAGIDLRATENIEIQPHCRALVGLGVRVAVPEGHVGLLFPRSGLALKRGLAFANGVGVIDAGYRGEVSAVIVNTSDSPAEVKRGERVAQLVVVPCLTGEVFTSRLDATDRGEGGFGSTGEE